MAVYHSPGNKASRTVVKWTCIDYEKIERALLKALFEQLAKKFILKNA
jgi:hypothetical protein